MSLFSRKKKTKAGLLIDRGMFRYLAIDGVVGDFSVAEHIAGVLPISSDYDGDPFARAGADLEPCFAEIAKQIPDLIGKVLKRDLAENEKISWEDLSSESLKPSA